MQNNNTAIPEYFAFQRYDLEKRIRIIALKVSLRQVDLVPDKDIEIFADTVILDSHLSLPGKNLLIHARIIVAQGNLIDVSGETAKGFTPGNQAALPDGHNQPAPETGVNGQPGADGAAGPNGKAGGKVTIIAERIEGHLAIRANGGAGGRGQDAGDGTPGGAGKDGNPGFMVNNKLIHDTTRGHKGAKGGDGGFGGEAGYGGQAGEIKLILLNPEADVSKIIMQSRLGERGSPGAHGRGGKGGPGGKGGEMHISFGGGGKHQRLPKLDKPDGQPGDDGDTGAKGLVATMLAVLRRLPREERLTWNEGILLERGKAYRSRAIRELDWEEGQFHPTPTAPSISHQEYTILHTQHHPSLAQKELTFHQAKLIFLARQYEQAGELLLWLVQSTPARNSKNSLAKDEVEEWFALHERSAALLGYVHQGLDYFGNPPDFVPLASIETYRRALTPLINTASIIERTYLDYAKQDRKREQRQQDFEKARQQISALLEVQHARELELGESIKINNEQIRQLSGQRVLLVTLLSRSDEEFQKALLRKTPRGCNFEDVLQAGETLIAITETAADLAINVRKGSAALKGIRQFKNVLENVGTVIKTVRSVKGDISKVADTFRSLESESGKAPPDSAKLLMAQEEFDGMIEPFLHLPEAKKYKQRMQDYIGLVQSRNRKIMETDAFRFALSDVKAEIGQLESKSKRLKTNWGTDPANDPTLADYRSLMLGLYEDSKSNLLRTLFHSYQAFSYWSLSQQTFRAADNTVAELASEYERLIVAMTDETNKLRSLPGVFKDTGITLTAEERPEAFKAFRNDGTISFELSVTDDESEFFGSANVRVTSWQAEIVGAVTSNKILRVDLHHGGKAAFKRPDGHRIDFSHKRLFGRYGYNIESGEMTEQTDISVDENLIFLSPFTTWTMRLRQDINRDLDLSKVSEIRLSFLGKLQPMEGKAGTPAVKFISSNKPSLPDKNWCGFTSSE